MTRVLSPEKRAQSTACVWPRARAALCQSATSQMRAVLSSEAVATHLPSAEKATSVTRPSCPTKLRPACRGCIPQANGFIVAGRENMLPSGEKTLALTKRVCTPPSLTSAVPLAAFQMRAALSQLPVTICSPPLANCTDETADWGEKVMSRLPSAACQRWASAPPTVSRSRCRRPKT